MKSLNIIAVLLVGLLACLLDNTDATQLSRRMQRTLAASKAKAKAKGSITLKNFLVISQARLSTVSYVNLDEVHAGGGNGDEPPKIHTLINFNLTTPSGLALCDGKLYVADPGRSEIYLYPLQVQAGPDGGHRIISTAERDVVATGVNAHWVSCNDITKDVFFTDEDTKLLNVIHKKDIEAAAKLSNPSAGHVVTPPFQSLYQSAQSPGGVADDNLYVFWAHTQEGYKSGSILKAVEKKDNEAQPVEISKRVDQTQGVCLNQAYVFFTDSESGFYAAPKDLGADTNEQGKKLASGLAQPRGCIWDQDGTIYVAEKGSNRVVSFAASIPHLRAEVEPQPVLQLEDPFDVAIFQYKYSRCSIPFFC